MVRSRSVERGFGGEVSFGAGILVPLAAKYPVALWRLHGTFTYEGRCLILAGTGCRVDVVRAIGCAQQVDVRINKAGQYGFSAQVYEFEVLSAKAAYLVIGTYGQDRAAGTVNSHGLRSWLCGVHCVDVAVQVKYCAHSCSLLLF